MEVHTSRLHVIQALRARLELDASLGSPFASGKPDQIAALCVQLRAVTNQRGTEKSQESPPVLPPTRSWFTPPPPQPPPPPAPPVRPVRPAAEMVASLVPEQDVVASEKDPLLAQLKEQALQCTLCALCERRNSVVWGEGSLDASVMFIGEGPGRDEDLQGRPFVGRSGRVLTDIIEKGMKQPRSQVFIATVVKCRPPGNREPRPDEVTACSVYLQEQINIIRPSVIVAVGDEAGCALLGLPSKSAGLRGKWHDYKGIPLRVIFHPSSLLRQRKDENDRTNADRDTWNDIQEVLKKASAID